MDNNKELFEELKKDIKCNFIDYLTEVFDNKKSSDKYDILTIQQFADIKAALNEEPQTALNKLNDIIINRNTLLPTLLVLSNNSILHCIEIIVCNPKYKALLEKYPDIIIAAKRRLRNYYNCFPDEQKEWLK